jgi:hypothetical protein
MKTRALGILVIVILAVSAGYLILSTPSAGEIVEMTLNSMENVKSYRFSMDSEMNMSTIGEKTASILMKMRGEGAVNYGERKIFVSTISEIHGEEGDMSIESDVYLMNDTMYMKMRSPEMGEQWMKMKLPEELVEQSWSSEDQIKQQMMLLNSSEVRRLPDEKVNGVECYVLEVKPDLQKFWEAIKSQYSLGELQGMNEAILEEALKNSEISMKEWIAKDSKLPMKSEIYMLMTISPEDFNISVENSEDLNFTMRMEMRMVMHFYDYNEVIEIELPEEAMNAIELPSL